MSMGAAGTVGSVAGLALQQAKGADVEATHQAARNQARRVEANRAAEAASGVGETEEDHKTEERDADGRRLWEQSSQGQDESDEQQNSSGTPGLSRDGAGERGVNLDLCG
jgi:hypothetical protein